MTNFSDSSFHTAINAHMAKKMVNSGMVACRVNTSDMKVPLPSLSGVRPDPVPVHPKERSYALFFDQGF
jgi:hypothetical protein